MRSSGGSGGGSSRNVSLQRVEQDRHGHGQHAERLLDPPLHAVALVDGIRDGPELDRRDAGQRSRPQDPEPLHRLDLAVRPAADAAARADRQDVSGRQRVACCCDEPRVGGDAGDAREDGRRVENVAVHGLGADDERRRRQLLRTRDPDVQDSADASLGQRRCGGERRLDRADAAHDGRSTVEVLDLRRSGADDQDHAARVYDRAMGYQWIDAGDLEFEERPAKEGEAAARRFGDLTDAVGLTQSRARMWVYPPHTTGRRHRDHAQEEVFVVLSGTATMLLGDEAERVDVGPGSVIAVQAMTPLQLRNETDDDLRMFVYGSPPLQEGADFLDDVELPPRA